MVEHQQNSLDGLAYDPNQERVSMTGFTGDQLEVLEKIVGAFKLMDKIPGIHIPNDFSLDDGVLSFSSSIDDRLINASERPEDLQLALLEMRKDVLCIIGLYGGEKAGLTMMIQGTPIERTFALAALFAREEDSKQHEKPIDSNYQKLLDFVTTVAAFIKGIRDRIVNAQREVHYDGERISIGVFDRKQLKILA